MHKDGMMARGTVNLVLRDEQGKVKQHKTVRNKITNQGLAHIVGRMIDSGEDREAYAYAPSMMKFMGLGIGTGSGSAYEIDGIATAVTPSATDTALQKEVTCGTIANQEPTSGKNDVTNATPTPLPTFQSGRVDMSRSGNLLANSGYLDASGNPSGIAAGDNVGHVENKIYQDKIKDLKNLPSLIEKTLLIDNDIQAIASTFNEAKGSMFLGRGFSYPIALEGALKLKELSYVHAEGYPAGEMKHGPLALIEEGMPVVVLAPRDSYYKKTISNMQEVIARGAKVLLITNKSKDEVVSENIWETIEVESTNDDLLPFLLTIPLQKLAYYSALKKGYDIDIPRNLAKSVTVE